MCMPWLLVDSPSIQVGMLHAALARAGIRARSHSLHLAFLDFAIRTLGAGDALTSAEYEVSTRWSNSGAPDWLFAVPPFGPRPKVDAARLPTSCVAPAWPVRCCARSRSCAVVCRSSCVSAPPRSWRPDRGSSASRWSTARRWPRWRSRARSRGPRRRAGGLRRRLLRWPDGPGAAARLPRGRLRRARRRRARATAAGARSRRGRSRPGRGRPRARAAGALQSRRGWSRRDAARSGAASGDGRPAAAGLRRVLPPPVAEPAGWHARAAAPISERARLLVGDEVALHLLRPQRH